MLSFDGQPGTAGEPDGQRNSDLQSNARWER
jgi:hypothetical protein